MHTFKIKNRITTNDLHLILIFLTTHIMTININLTEVFIYTLVFVTLTSIIYYIITFDESKFYKRLFRGVDIFISSLISLAIMFISYSVYDLLCDIHFTFTF